MELTRWQGGAPSQLISVFDRPETGGTLKRDRYLALVAERKTCCVCSGLHNPAELRDYDSDEIGPWSRLHGDLDARLMVVGQDWGDFSYYSRNSGLDDPKIPNPTNQMIETLLESVGFAGALRPGLGPRGVFLTNAILCLKGGGLQGRVKSEWFANCAVRFLGAQIQLVSPRVVVALGGRAYEAVLRAFRYESGALRPAVKSAFGTALPNGSTLIPVYHCGRRVQNRYRSPDAQLRDWRRVARALAEPT